MSALSEILTAKALDGLALREQAIAHNIANAQSPDFKPLRVRFETALAAASKTGAEAVSRVTPRIEIDSSAPLRVDLEASDAALTAARYAALVDVLNKQLQIRALASSGGR
jgi:flagellar basal-body rod protein FlgB